jgi:flagellar biosynthesis/type III secretory pathway protein FliH
MSRTVTIQLRKPIVSACVVDKATACPEREGAEPEGLERREQKGGLVQVCKALQEALGEVNEFRKNLFREHKEQIAKLSVEIARKILMQEVQDGNYKIESIVEKTLESASTHQDAVVHLNPEDFAQYEKLRESAPKSALADIKVVADPNVGRAECLLETPRGIVESFINEHLERIGEAFKNV